MPRGCWALSEVTKPSAQRIRPSSQAGEASAGEYSSMPPIRKKRQPPSYWLQKTEPSRQPLAASWLCSHLFDWSFASATPLPIRTFGSLCGKNLPLNCRPSRLVDTSGMLAATALMQRLKPCTALFSLAVREPAKASKRAMSALQEKNRYLDDSSSNSLL